MKAEKEIVGVQSSCRDRGSAIQGVRHIAVLIGSSAEGGLQAVQSSHVRISDATSAAAAQQPSLGWLCFPGPPAIKASNILLCKLHKVMPLHAAWSDLRPSPAAQMPQVLVANLARPKNRSVQQSPVAGQSYSHCNADGAACRVLMESASQQILQCIAETLDCVLRDHAGQYHQRICCLAVYADSICPSTCGRRSSCLGGNHAPAQAGSGHASCRCEAASSPC